MQYTSLNEANSLLKHNKLQNSYIETTIQNFPDGICYSCHLSEALCECQHTAAVQLDEDNKIFSSCFSKHKFAQSLLFLITLVLSVAIIGSAILMRHLDVPVSPNNDDKNPLMMSVFLDDETTSRYEVVDNTVDIIKGRRMKRVLASGTYVKNSEEGGDDIIYRETSLSKHL
jgi:hypothetical protein